MPEFRFKIGDVVKVKGGIIHYVVCVQMLENSGLGWMIFYKIVCDTGVATLGENALELVFESA